MLYGSIADEAEEMKQGLDRLLELKPEQWEKLRKQPAEPRSQDPSPSEWSPGKPRSRS
jgi:hypothetical protein